MVDTQTDGQTQTESKVISLHLFVQNKESQLKNKNKERRDGE
jgi:hypothetical protein